MHYTGIALNDLVRRAEFIFVVEKAEPFLTTEEIPVRKFLKEYPPFKKYTYHFRIIEELYKEDKVSRQGELINVIPDNFDEGLEIHKKYYLEGITKSPLYAKYDTAADFFKADKLILFLRRYDAKTFEIIASGAYEALLKKKEILELIKKEKPAEGR
ncbi:MAG: hypothetical protein PHG51_00785 [Candidatus Omnitrophica bacterium]|nr:hypothetical protein [Candidatus Omnitrophota bacterium]